MPFAGVTTGCLAHKAALVKLALTLQKPLQRAYQRDPGAIERCRHETYPAIAEQARTEGSEVFFSDESAFRAHAVHGRTRGAKGQTPTVERPGQRQSTSAASAVNAKGGLVLQLSRPAQLCTWQTRGI
jgi:hypothetical protein